MNTQLKPSLQRIRSIMGANLSNLVVGFFISLVLTTSSALGLAVLDLTHHITIDEHFLYVLLIGIIFVAPVLSYFSAIASTHPGGITNVTRDMHAVKRNFFLAIGTLWVSLGALLLNLAGPTYPTLQLTASIFLVASWYTITSTVVNYVTNH